MPTIEGRAKSVRVTVDQFIAIDPGPNVSAWLVWQKDRPARFGIENNETVLRRIDEFEMPLAIEMVASYGMPVGKDVFETVVWIGRFIQRCKFDHRQIYRKDVKMHLCQSMRAKDGNIRQALLDRFPPSGGGKTPQVGTKAQPGPLYGIKSHLWAALAVAVYHWDVNVIDPQPF